MQIKIKMIEKQEKFMFTETLDTNDEFLTRNILDNFTSYFYA